MVECMAGKVGGPMWNAKCLETRRGARPLAWVALGLVVLAVLPAVSAATMSTSGAVLSPDSGPGVSRMGHAVFDGKVFYIFRHSMNGLWGVDRYDPATQVENGMAAAIPQADSDLGPAVWIGNAAYVFGWGDSGLGTIHKTYRFDPVSNSFSTMATPTPAALPYNAAAFSDGTYAYVIGCDNPQCFTQRYNPATDTWTTMGMLQPVPGSQFHPRTAAYGGGRGYILASSDTQSFVHGDGVYIINPSTGEGTPHNGVLPTNVFNAAAAWSGGRLYILGGREVTGAPSAAIQVYDPWSDTAVLSSTTVPTPAAEMSASATGSCDVYLFARTGDAAKPFRAIDSMHVPDLYSPGQSCPNQPVCGTSGYEADKDCDGVCNQGWQDSSGDHQCTHPDNCPSTPNKDQTDSDKDGYGDACDSDRDGDGVGNPNDNCPDTSNADQKDSDHDGKGDACDATSDCSPGVVCETYGDRDDDGIEDHNDNCPDTANPNQADTDKDGQGDACDNDRDNDDVANANDNCPDTPNHDQKDADHDGIGDACDPTPTLLRPAARTRRSPGCAGRSCPSSAGSARRRRWR